MLALVLAAAGMIPSAPLRAEDFAPDWSREKGVVLGLQFQTDLIGAEDPSAESPPDQIFVEEAGHGGLVHLGYTFTPRVCVRLAMGGAFHGTTIEGVEVSHSSATLEIHYRFLPGERARPYLFGGIGGATLEYRSGDFQSEVTGGVAVLGAGFLYHVTRHLLVDVAARLDSINWNEIRVRRRVGGVWTEISDPVDDAGSAGKVLLGMSWQF
jgi:opacity protein-like surface antigen